MPWWENVACCTARDNVPGEKAPVISACVRRGGDGEESTLETEDSQQFFDCIEWDDDGDLGSSEAARPGWWAVLKRRTTALVKRRSRAFGQPLRPLDFPPLDLHHFPEEATVCLERTCLRREFAHFTHGNVVNVAHEVKLFWKDRIHNGHLDDQLEAMLKDGFPELEEWTEDEVVRRMLRAACGQEREAIQTLTRAIEHRLRERVLFQTMSCKVACDMRVIGRDVEGRPTIYMCAKSQLLPLKDLKPQIFLAFETAVQLGSPDGQCVVIADMTGFCARLNMDPFTLKDLADSFGTVFADRLNSVLIVDFSLLAQTVWSTCRALLSERTQRKINFVDERRARGIIQEGFDRQTCVNVLSALEINRKRSTTAEARASHAQRTSISDVPLGICTADKAG